ncbi:hypothetical protein [Mucilaginibacter aquaedulcis]|uniref:hypothetical protein n=1 Tax=Mucilaginibacter aquaedulcis TaxID=1187081 RepID=UPI0025B53A91|nr:hypothetical protein [Mucilaginibacter aquaedulcis]MDN3548734.1 hypothetical protein [Mucilaginibacter aquaedulcis]
MDRSFINRLKQDRYFDHLSTDSFQYTNSLYHRLMVQSDRWRFGDLYGLCYLPQYRFELEPYKKYFKSDTTKVTGRDLYLIGDSYLADKQMDGAFKGFDRVIFLDDRFPFGPLVLDRSRQSYLVLEFAERNLNEYDFDKTTETKCLPPELQTGQNLDLLHKPSGTVQALSFWQRFCNIFFNKDISRNLETLLFENTIFTPSKELKAELNYKLIGSLPKEVVISTDQRRLLMNATVDMTNQLSSFRKFDNMELTVLNKNLNNAAKYYRSIGFKKIFLSVIPNPVSIYEDKRMQYNHLLERLEKTTTLPVISVFDDFKKTKQNLFYRSDTHWNPDGFDKWINAVNHKKLY